MTIEIKKNQEETIIEIVGRLDTITAPALDKTINEDIGDTKNLVLDVKGMEYISSAGLRVLLAAPTGRAAKRMSEVTSRPAKTIHRLLEVQWGEGDKPYFDRNERNPLVCDVIIIDEMSMVDITLMHALLKAVLAGTRLILVGDVNQLPSVGPGNILRDVIHSDRFKTVRLTKIFRQAGESGIVVNAHKINKGQKVMLDNSMKDFLFMKRNDADVIISVALTLIRDKLPKYVNASMQEIQVLTPMRKGLLGVERLNGILQMYLNPESPSKREKEYGGVIFREGDKVMQIKNNYDLEYKRDNGEYGYGVFNGDVGYITDIDIKGNISSDYWGTWIRMDNGDEYYINDFSVLKRKFHGRSMLSKTF